MKEHKVKKLPVVTAEGELQGMYVWNDVKDDASKSSKFSLDNEGHFLVGAAIGNNPLSPNNPTLWYPSNNPLIEENPGYYSRDIHLYANPANPCSRDILF